MHGSATAHNLAVALLEEHDLNASLKVVENRVWSLTSRNVPTRQVREIVLSEFSKSNSQKFDLFETAEDSLIVDLAEWR